MENLQLRLILTGLIVILAGFLYGMVYTVAVDHVPRLTLHDDYGSSFGKLAENNSATSASDEIAQVRDRSVKVQRAIGAHTHAIYLGLVIIILGLLFNVALAETRYKSQVANALCAGVILYPLGLALQASGLVLAGEGLALLGSITVIACVSLFLFRLLTLQKSN